MSQTVKTREQLKSTFVTGAVPTQQDYHDLFDAMVHQSEITADSEAVTPFEQYVIANTQSYVSNMGDGGHYELNTKRLPMIMQGATSLTYDSNNSCVSRTILFHKGRFYDNNQAGEILHAFATIPVTPATAPEKDSVQINLDSTSLVFSLNPDQYTEEDESLLTWIVTSNRTIHWNGYTFVFTIDSANSTTEIEILGSRDTMGPHTLDVYYYAQSNDPLNIYGDDAHTTAPEYGGDDANGYFIANPSASGSARLYFKLTNTPNPSTADIGYYQAECYYCEESDLTPGTYYAFDQNNPYSPYWLTEVVVEQPAA